MILKMYTVYDAKTEAYLPPFFMKNTGEALRAWEEVANDQQSNICKYASDFTLFEIGTWDDSNSELSLHLVKLSMGTALEFKKSSKPLGDVIPHQISNYVDQTVTA